MSFQSDSALYYGLAGRTVFRFCPTLLGLVVLGVGYILAQPTLSTASACEPFFASRCWELRLTMAHDFLRFVFLRMLSPVASPACYGFYVLLNRHCLAAQPPRGALRFLFFFFLPCPWSYFLALT